MTDETHELLDRALQLPVDLRTILAVEIVASLEEDDHPSGAPAHGEITRRLREVLEGRVETVAFEQALEQARRAVAEVRQRR